MTHGFADIYHTRCLVKPDKQEEITPGGIVIPLIAQNLSHLDMHEMTLVGIGSEAFKDSREVPNIGDRVWVAIDESLKFTGKDGETYYMVNYKSIFGKTGP